MKILIALGIGIGIGVLVTISTPYNSVVHIINTIKFLVVKWNM